MGISIIVVNYNNYKLTIKCIKSVLEKEYDFGYEIIVVDNNSQNDSFQILEKEFSSHKNIKLIKNSKNVGFGAANNYAVENSKYQYLLFLNPDVVVIDDAIEKMYKKIINDDSIGLIGCKLLNADSTVQHSCRRFIPFGKFVLARTPLRKMFSKSYIKKINNQYLMVDFEHDEDKIVDWIMGSCMLLTKEVFLRVQGFSKEYFMYFEDVDLCYKVHKMGKSVVYSPSAKMYHLHRQESVKKINKLTFIHLTSMVKFYRKYKKVISKDV